MFTKMLIVYAIWSMVFTPLFTIALITGAIELKK